MKYLISLLLVLSLPSPGLANDSSPRQGSPKFSTSKAAEKYLDLIANRITRVWFPAQLHERETVVVVFKIHRDGSVSDITIQTASSKIGKSCAIAAIKNASPFAKLPDGLGEELGVQFVFNQSIFSSERHPAKLYRFAKANAQ